ncbi:MAG: helix-turn-helix transcriptional regulator, partial [Ruminococcaceae bacterium]|nr:helix-turn-helix transcriptional regulator [Oscillospiraceae bacterium]
IKVYRPLIILGVMFDERYISPAIYERILTRETMGLDHIAQLDDRQRNVTAQLFEVLRCVYEGKPEKAETPLGEMYAGRLLDCLLIDVLRSCSDETRSVAKSQIGSAILHIHSHYNERITLESAAERVHLSAGYFSELFKDSTGQTFKSYLTEHRMRNACRMLANTDMSVTDICYACGFESFSNFMRIFKKYQGTSPLKFRAENKSEKLQ